MSVSLYGGFPGSSVGKESACNAEYPGSIPAGERIGYPLQYSWASLVGQMVKNPPVMWDTWVLTLGWGDSLEKGTATYSSIHIWMNFPFRVQWSRNFYSELPIWVMSGASLPPLPM